MIPRRCIPNNVYVYYIYISMEICYKDKEQMQLCHLHPSPDVIYFSRYFQWFRK